MNLVEISERAVIEAAKVWAEAIRWRQNDDDPGEPEVAATVALHDAVILLISREALPTGAMSLSDIESDIVETVDNNPTGILAQADVAPIDECEVIEDPPYTPAEQHGFTTRFPPQSAPIYRRKLSRRAQEIEKRRQADPLGADREDIDYDSDELPSVR